MKDKTITIDVQGVAGSGKTVLLSEITRFLTGLGFQVAPPLMRLGGKLHPLRLHQGLYTSEKLALCRQSAWAKNVTIQLIETGINRSEPTQEEPVNE